MKSPFAFLVLAATAVFLVWFPRQPRRAPSPTPIPPPTVASPDKQGAATVKEGLMAVDHADLTASEPRELEAIYRPMDDTRRVTEEVRLGQPVLCDVFAYDDGRIAYTTVTPASMVADSGEPRLVFRSETTVLHPDHPDAGPDTIASPTVLMREGQQATIALGRDDGTTYSMQLSGTLVGDDSLVLSAEMSGDPAGFSTSR